MSKPLTIEGIKQVAVIDDELESRESYQLAVEDMECEPILEEEPSDNADLYAKNLVTRVQAAFCDFQLMKHDYAKFNGDELASKLYALRLPVIICTEYASWKNDLHRGYRRNIPIVISYKQAEPDTIMRAYEICIQEFDGKFLDIRKPVRTLIRLDDIDEDESFTYVVVPGWSARSRVRIKSSNLPENVLSSFKSGKKRLYAHVNLGAEADEDLFFAGWELE